MLLMVSDQAGTLRPIPSTLAANIAAASSERP
jgi:hypothetical protein